MLILEEAHEVFRLTKVIEHGIIECEKRVEAKDAEIQRDSEIVDSSTRNVIMSALAGGRQGGTFGVTSGTQSGKRKKITSSGRQEIKDDDMLGNIGL